MSIFGLLKKKDINSLVEECYRTKNSILLDVRTEEEYNSGHIEKSINIPLQRIEDSLKIISDKSTPIYVYCRSGGRSSSATALLTKLGYSNVINIGGITSYMGKVVR